jgi:hypothetical protein
MHDPMARRIKPMANISARKADVDKIGVKEI